MKRFNDTGLCIPERHYMVDISQKIEKIIRLIENGDYFTINRPRQFGKTTTLFLLMRQLFEINTYLPLRISFEGLSEESYSNQKRFLEGWCFLLQRFFQFNQLPDLLAFTKQHCQIETFEQLSMFISDLCEQSKQPIVLMVDEVDRMSNNQLFLDFLALLRTKYLARNEGQDISFQSVILAGVHDIKTLKAKIRPESEQKYNSPWNIAIDFDIDLSFTAAEIKTMLQDYGHERDIQLNMTALAARFSYYTSGYPYLVSKMCKFIDEKLVTERADKTWQVDDVEMAFKLITQDSYTTTLFDSLIKNLENNPELYELVSQVVMNGQKTSFNISVPMVNLAYLYGILTKADDGSWCQIHNRIFEQRLYNYFMTKLQLKNSDPLLALQPDYYTATGLNLPLILRRFQAFMQENYAERDAKFLEREGRLLFLSFLKPIINGKGFDFKEPNVGDERRMDIVITYSNKRYVLELKIWYGQKAHEEGLQQLCDYLDLYGLLEGYLLIYDFNKNKAYKEEQLEFQGKQILAVWV